MVSLKDGLRPTANSLNALRLLLAVTVIVSHSWPLGGFGQEPKLGGVTPGTWAVFGFFAISGYLIMGSRVANTFADFLQRRLLRIYPAFFVCLVVTAFIVAPIAFWSTRHTFKGFATSYDSPVNYVISNLTLKMTQYQIASGPENIPLPKTWDGSLWTLYYEFGCYLLIGVAGCWGFFRRRPIAVGVVFLMATAAFYNAADVTKYVQNTDVNYMIELSPAFLAGAWLYMVRERVPLRAGLAAGSVVVAVLIALFGPAKMIGFCALPIAYGVLWLGAVLPLHRVGRKNDISYGVYIYGFIVEQLVSLYGGNEYGQVVYIALSVVLTVPLAVASWFLVERPAIGRRNRHVPQVTPQRDPDLPEPSLIRAAG